jgi:UrcA family protein
MLGVLSGCVSSASAVQDAPKSEWVRQKRVSYAGLDLDSDAGARTLIRRLKSAAEQVCEPLAGERLEQKQRWRECYEHALTHAVRDLNHPQVTLLYEGAAKRPM